MVQLFSNKLIYKASGGFASIYWLIAKLIGLIIPPATKSLRYAFTSLCKAAEIND